MSDQNKLNRRQFIKGAATAGAGLAAVGALGACSPTPVPTTPVPPTAVPPTKVPPTAVPATAVPPTAVPPTAVPTKAPAPVAPGFPAKWDNETDVLIIGSGYAGLCAAIEATKAGAKVLILEKGVVPGGNSILCAGNANFGGGTLVQKLAKVEDKPEWFYEDIYLYGEHRAVPELLKTFVDNNVECVAWLQTLGLKFRATMGQNEGMRVQRGHSPDVSPDYPGNSGNAYWTVLNNAAVKGGATTLLKHQVTRLIRPDPNGPVVGVEVLNEGKTLYFKARRAVFLGSGGWKSNVYMRMAWDPRLDTDLSAGGLPYVNTTGECIMQAVDIGAGLTDMSYVCEFRFKWGTKVYQLWEPPVVTNVTSGAGLSISDFQKVVMVKNDGKRFVNEVAASLYPQKPFYEAFINLAERPRAVWAIADAKGVADFKWAVDAFKSPQPLKTPALSPDTVAVADTLEDLAKKINVPAANLVETIKRYNGFVDAGKDEDFGKPKPTTKIATGPFYAAKCQFFAHDQMGGLRANTKGQVLDRQEQLSGKVIPIDQQKVIPNLYAAGESVGGYVGTDRGHGKISIYMVFARIAGKYAAGEKPLA
jgi:flavocytochrome c